MSKLICKYTKILKDIEGVSVCITKGEIYYVYTDERYIIYREDEEIGEIWGTISDYFITPAESRDQRIDEILNDD